MKQAILAVCGVLLTTCLAWVSPAAAGDLPISTNLVLLTDQVTRPVAVRHAGDGSGRIFIVEQPGRIRVVDNGSLVDTPVLDIDDDVVGGTSGGSEQGLLGIAFHPDFSRNAYFFVNYIGSGSDTYVVRFQMTGGDASANTADPTSATTFMNITQDFGNHNGGDLHFGPDGMLYIGMGDGGSARDPCDRSQQLDPADDEDGCAEDTTAALLGKMLRIDVDSARPPYIFTDGFGDFIAANEPCGADADGSAMYSIPATNPFIDSNDTCDEMWSYGLRNPYRFSFDRDTGDMFIGDVGQGAIEEIDFEPMNTAAGINYGWSCREGDIQQDFNPCQPGQLQDPILQYSHAAGRCSVTGGYRYRGPLVALQGFYVYGDYCTGEMFFASESSPGTWSMAGIFETGFTLSLSGFGEDEAGNLYVTNLNGGAVYRIDDNNAARP